MTICRRIFLAAFAPFTLSCVCSAEEAQSERKSEAREKWIGRITVELAKLDEKDRSSEVAIAAFAMAAAGEDDRSKEVMRRLLPREERDGALLGIADAQSQGDRVKESLATVAEFSTEDGRQSALALVAIRQAQRGDVEDAVKLLSKVKNEGPRDRLLSAIAQTQAKAGELEAARDTAKQIADEQRRRQAVEGIADAAQGAADPIAGVRSSSLRAHLRVMLEFSGVDGQREAIHAIVAAQENDRASLSKHISAALDESRDSIPLERATTRTLLAIALVEAGDREEAREMILRAREAGSKEWLGVSSLFGNPILVHLLIRLNMQDELQSLMDSLRESDSFAASIPYHANLSAIGGAYAELDRLGEAEKWYNRLESPIERVHFSTLR